MEPLCLRGRGSRRAGWRWDAGALSVGSLAHQLFAGADVSRGEHNRSAAAFRCLVTRSVSEGISRSALAYASGYQLLISGLRQLVKKAVTLRVTLPSP